MPFKTDQRRKRTSPVKLSKIDEDDVEADLLPLVSRRMQPRDDLLVLPLGRLVLLCLGAMLIGALIPTLFHNTDQTAVSREPGVVDKDHQAAPSHLVPEDLRPHDTTLQNSDEASIRHNASGRNGPALAWLMSFPNSGTSYTMNLVTAASNMSQATNYGLETRVSSNHSVPVFEDGPFWLKPNDTLPTETVVTKTHCGGYCHDCRPGRSVESPHSFLMHCALADDSVTVVLDDEDGQQQEQQRQVRFVYDYMAHVDRAIHLIRDPLDNMVSRYHLGIHKFEQDDGLLNNQTARYTYDRDGFAAFCQDQLRSNDEHHDSHVDQRALSLIEDVPCHMDLFRYVQWHNLAFIATRDFLDIPTHVLHYEDYSTRFNETLAELMEFLGMPNTGAIAAFVPGKSYRDYYTEDQIARMKNATKLLASPMTWKHLERYF